MFVTVMISVHQNGIGLLPIGSATDVRIKPIATIARNNIRLMLWVWRFEFSSLVAGHWLVHVVEKCI